MTGTLVNIISIMAGAIAGVLLKKGIPERINTTIIQGLSMAIVVIGIQMAIQTKNPLIVVLSLVLGGLSGELLHIEKNLDSLGLLVEKKMGNGQGDFAKGFVTASLVYCVGAMAVVGSIQDGLQGDSSTLFVKSMLDGVSAVFFASTMGFGVAFSAIPVLIYQGSISLLAQYVQSYLTQPVINEMSATGGVLIMGIGLKLLGVKDVKVGNLLPSILFAVIISILAKRIGL